MYSFTWVLGERGRCTSAEGEINTNLLRAHFCSTYTKVGGGSLMLRNLDLFHLRNKVGSWGWHPCILCCYLANSSFDTLVGKSKIKLNPEFLLMRTVFCVDL